jgi:hypothetical protein
LRAELERKSGMEGDVPGEIIDQRNHSPGHGCAFSWSYLTPSAPVGGLRRADTKEPTEDRSIFSSRT